MESNYAYEEYQLSDCSGNFRYRILADINSHLVLLDKTLGKICIMSAIELILNNDHLKCSPDDILRIGFIFGQRTASGLG